MRKGTRKQRTELTGAGKRIPCSACWVVHPKLDLATILFAVRTYPLVVIGKARQHHSQGRGENNFSLLSSLCAAVYNHSRGRGENNFSLLSSLSAAVYKKNQDYLRKNKLLIKREKNQMGENQAARFRGGAEKHAADVGDVRIRMRRPGGDGAGTCGTV
ncbi:uncharacterized protein LOC116264694 isoform X1 [Nymphaea colorata]|uniref:uncharacterized protein LOC116264694 isoform X1 n=1 Tax=Nymphaea colorata TaxID=210225 RepID=UPI00129EB8E5|nr:uncharacterized protein LOC116264694 isoform X1 [Nymphaea colorata]